MVHGFKQRKGKEAFAHTVSGSSARLLSTIACGCGLALCHFDVNQHSIRSDLDVSRCLPFRMWYLYGEVV